MKRLGVAEGVNYHSLNQSETRNIILRVLENSSYALNAQKWSVKFRDQKEKPLDRSIWWIEWLLRNPTCGYLKSPTFRLGFIQANSYDVIIFVTFAITLTLVIALKLFWIFIRTFYKFTKINKNARHEKVE